MTTRLELLEGEGNYKFFNLGTYSWLEVLKLMVYGFDLIYGNDCCICNLLTALMAQA